MKLKTGDKIVVLSGRDKGKSGEIAKVLPAVGQVIADGLNVVKRHTKPSNKHPKGGILDISKPMPAAKVALVCPSCKKPTRVGYQMNKTTKERICRKCKAVLK